MPKYHKRFRSTIESWTQSQEGINQEYTTKATEPGPHHRPRIQVHAYALRHTACERSFLTLKYMKNRFRSSLSQQRLEAFMLMATQTDVLQMLDSEKIIDSVAEKSELL